MISLFDARTLVLSMKKEPETELVPLENSLNRILSEDLFSDLDLPPFPKSAMDGFACKKEDIYTPMKIIGTIYAGDTHSFCLQKKECVRIMTGARIPEGCDLVLRKENTQMKDGLVFAIQEERSKNICLQGEDIKKGQKILCKGTKIHSRHIGILAATSHTTLKVFKPFKIAIASTGNELVPMNQVPTETQIRDSNAPMLQALCQEAGASSTFYGQIPDQKGILSQKLHEMIQENDILLFSGGVSAGDLDLLPEVLEANEFEFLFKEVKIRPGLPTKFARKNQILCFGLPGNPLAVYFVFQLLIKPLICYQDSEANLMEMTLEGEIRRKKSDRLSLIPVKKISASRVKAVEWHGPANLFCITEACGLVLLSEGQEEICNGEKVSVYFFS